MIDYDAIRISNPLPAFCESRGIRLSRDGTSGRLKSLCPFHEEKKPSFTIWPDGHYYCYGCGAHGDVTELCMALDGISKSDAARKLSADAERFPPSTLIKPVLPPPKPEPYQLSLQDRKRMAMAAQCLAQGARLIEKLIGKRPEWTVGTIRGVALEGDLGYEAGRIFFGYSHGIKARWKDLAGERVIRWLVGSAAGECWRAALLISSHQTVYITEGESDALTLISLGAEMPGESLVVALASAGMMPKSEPFAGRNIVIVPDPDQAGKDAANKLRGLLQPVARSIVTVPIQKVLNGPWGYQ